MSHYGDHPRLSRATEPADTSVWHWFVCKGPHGERFTWHREQGRRSIERLSGFIAERESSAPGFTEKARLIALEALGDEDPVLVLTGIQVLAAIGSDEDLAPIQELLAHPDARVQSNARSALFERGIKPRRLRA